MVVAKNPLTVKIAFWCPHPDVATYDLQPEMSAPELTDKLVDAILSKKYDTIICNYANPDMVGHTGNLEATIEAIEALDACLARVVEALESVGGEALITADHGNAELLNNKETGQAHTAHTSNPVPLIYLGRPGSLADTGSLCDVAPPCSNSWEWTSPAKWVDAIWLRWPQTTMWREMKTLNSLCRSTGTPATTAGRKFAAAAVFALLLMLLTLGSWPSISQAGDNDSADDQKLEQLRQQIQVLRRELDSDVQRRQSLQSRLQRSERHIGKVVALLKKLKRQLRTQQRELKKLNTRRSGLQSDLHKHRVALAQQIRAAYTIGQQEYVKILLNQQDPLRSPAPSPITIIFIVPG